MINTLIADAIRTMDAEAKKKALTLGSDIKPDVPELVMGDSSRIRQILLNLVSNGIKFTEKGGLTLKVEVQDEIDEDNVFLLFKCIDILQNAGARARDPGLWSL